MMTIFTQIKDYLTSAVNQFPDSGSPLLDMECLLQYTLEKNKSFLYSQPQTLLSETQHTQLKQLIRRRQKGCPIAYLTHTQDFYDLTFTVNPQVLIPRPETEFIIDKLLEKLPNTKPLRLLDLGTGSGNIAITLAKHRPSWKIFASDISHDALLTALQNQLRHQTHVQFLQVSWLNAFSLTPYFDCIISNPPYIDREDPLLSADVANYEPEIALYANSQGNADLQHIASKAYPHLKPNGLLILEHGYNQSTMINQHLKTEGYLNIEQFNDLSNHTRITLCKK